MMQTSFRRVPRAFCRLAVVFASLGLLIACTSNPPAPAAKPSADGLAWQDFSLVLCSPDDLTSLQKQAFQNYAMAVPAFLVGMDFTADGLVLRSSAKTDLPLRGTRIQVINQRDGLAIWRLEGTVGLPVSSRSTRVLQTVGVEASTLDPELAASAVRGQYPANRLVVVLATRAIREAARAGHAQGTIRLVQLQFDSQSGRFRAKFEVI